MRRSLLFTYAAAGVVALAAAFACAEIAHGGVHRSGNDALLLLPVSNVRFWFIPFVAIGCAAVAVARGLPSRGLVVSSALFVGLCGASIVQWYRAGLRLGPRWMAADVAAIMND